MKYGGVLKGRASREEEERYFLSVTKRRLKDECKKPGRLRKCSADFKMSVCL